MYRLTMLIAVSAFLWANLAWAQADNDVSYLDDVAYSGAPGIACGCDANNCGGEVSDCDAAGCGCQDCVCDACCCGRWFLLPQNECGINLHGWIDAGFMGNTSSPTSRFNGPYNAVDRSNEIMMNQLYLVAEKGLPDRNWGLVFRVDALYGEDFFLAQSIGMETRQDGSAHWNGEYYGIAVPQAYAALGNNDISFQVGHFYSLTLGANWAPTHNFRLRPEIRADWYTGNAVRLPYDDRTDDSQLTLGLDAILLF